jgi:hypothetical protein
MPRSPVSASAAAIGTRPSRTAGLFRMQISDARRWIDAHRMMDLR